MASRGLFGSFSVVTLALPLLGAACAEDETPTACVGNACDSIQLVRPAPGRADAVDAGRDAAPDDADAP